MNICSMNKRTREKANVKKKEVSHFFSLLLKIKLLGTTIEGEKKKKSIPDA